MEITVTLNSFIPDVRVVMRDVNGGGYSDNVILSGIAEGFRRMWSSRPASRFVKGVLTTPNIPQDTTQLGEATFTLDDKWRRGIVCYAAAYCYESGLPDTVNLQMAQSLKQQAELIFKS